MWFLAAPAAGSSLYLLLLTLLSARCALPRQSSRTLRVDVVIPAHNEESGIAEAVRSVRAIDWPTNCFRVSVVADNCTDGTADAAARAGARVLVRQEAERRGKGHALSHAFTEILAEGWAQAVVVVDADSRVSTNLLESIAARIEGGERVVQVHYGVSNTNASWRTRLMAIAMAAFHRVRSRGRERLGLSCGVRGNGWAVASSLLREMPYASYSLTEDLEYGIDLGMRGIRVAYADEASCDGEMVSTARDAQSQRRRWEQGRIALLRARALPLLKHAVVSRSLVCLDLAFDLLVLPLSYVALFALALTVTALLLAPASERIGPWFWVGVSCCIALALYVLRGWQLSGTGLRGLLDLLRAPFFLVWKLAVMLLGRRTSEWVRTSRENS